MFVICVRVRVCVCVCVCILKNITQEPDTPDITAVATAPSHPPSLPDPLHNDTLVPGLDDKEEESVVLDAKRCYHPSMAYHHTPLMDSESSNDPIWLNCLK